MVYLYVGKNTIKLFALTKTLLGQFTVAYFEKTHSSDLLVDGHVKNIDLLASAIKEAFTSSAPQPITDRDIILILPQQSFDFARYSVPPDISPSAVLPFVRDKVRADVHFDIDNSLFDYYLKHRQNESTVFLFAQKHSTYKEFAEVFKLLQLSIQNIIPETISYYTLFEKTLRQDKKEHILYTFFNGEASRAYLFDYLGLLSSKEYTFTEGDNETLKKIIEETKTEGIDLNRLIISGEASKKIRQDLFTKEIGVWTNPLDKIIQNFYQTYLKVLLADGKNGFSLLHYDVCLGAFIFTQENQGFSLIKNASKLIQKKGLSIPAVSFGVPGFIKGKGFWIFLLTMLVTGGLVYAAFTMRGQLSSFNQSILQKSTPTVTPEPTTKPSPTPAVQREDIKIKILNGSGTRGKASEARDILLEAGYTEVLTGNADSFDFTTTELAVKEGKDDIAQLVIDDLSEYVSIKNDDVITLDEDEAADIVLTIGADFE